MTGLNQHVRVELNPDDAGSQVFPMLHYDTGEAGVYEFGTVDGTDAPVKVAGNIVVVGPLNITTNMDDMSNMSGTSDMSNMSGTSDMGSESMEPAATPTMGS